MARRSLSEHKGKGKRDRPWILSHRTAQVPRPSTNRANLPIGTSVFSNQRPCIALGKPTNWLDPPLSASSLSGFITGVTIPVDGGFNAYSGV